MAKQEKSAIPEIPIVKLGPDEKPYDVVFAEWDILFDVGISTKKRDQIIGRLLNKVAKFKSRDKTITTSLKFQTFVSEDNDLLHVLRVYRQFKTPPKDKSSSKTIKKRSKLSVLEATEPVNPANSVAGSGPIRTPGPPVPTPPAGVMSISNTVGLTIEDQTA